MPPPPAAARPGPTKLKPANGANGNAGTKKVAEAEDDGAKRAGKPNQAEYQAEQDGYNKEIAEIKTKLDAIRAKISGSSAGGSSDRRTAIKTEMDSLRSSQGNFKTTRQKTLDEMKRLQEGVQRKIKDAQAQRGKLQFRSVQEIDERIDALNSQVESGSMKLVDEKKALAEISTLRRSRKQLEATGSADDAIAADRARIDDLRKVLDDPENKKLNDRYDELKKEMDGLREEGNKAYEQRNQLFDERTALSAKMDELYGKKRDSAQKHRGENDKYWSKVQADRAARQERYKTEKAKEDAARREEEIIRLREDAQMPAYQAEVEDCNVLIGWFKGKFGGSEVPSTNAGGKAAPASASSLADAGVKDLELRQVESDFKGMTLKKKGDDEDFGGWGSLAKKGKKGAAKGSKPASGAATPAEPTPPAGSSSASVNLPMSLLSALLSLGIPPPTAQTDVQRTVDDLETKKAWFEANSAAKTKAEIERVEKLVLKMQKKNALILGEDGEGADADALEDADEEAEVAGAKEPTHTVAVAGEAVGKDEVKTSGEQLPTDASPNKQVEKVDEALEEVADSQDKQ